MSSVILSFCCLVFLALFNSQASGLDFQGSKVGDICERDYHCIQHAFCRSQKTCLCEPNYLPVPDYTICIPTVGLFCSNNTVCAGMSNAECVQNICACKETFAVDIRNSSNCIARPAAEHDRCQRNDDCIESLGRALCINNQCQCLTDHHFSTRSQQCVETSGIGQNCQTDDQCYMSEMGADANSLVCTENICKCGPGITSTYCSGGLSNTGTIMIAVILYFFTIFIG